MSRRALCRWCIALAVFFAAYFALRTSRAAMTALWYGAVLPAEQWLGRLCGRLTLSVGEVLILTAVFCAILWLANVPRRIIAARGRRWGMALRLTLTALCAVLTVYAGFCLTWGIGYNTDGFQEKSGIHARPSTAETLAEVTAYFAGNLAACADDVPRDESGVCTLDRQAVLNRSASALDVLCGEFPFLRAETGGAKGFACSRALSTLRFTGFYFPFTGEPNVNMDSPAAFLPATVCHELAHQRGITAEEECNFIGIRTRWWPTCGRTTPTGRSSGASSQRSRTPCMTAFSRVMAIWTAARATAWSRTCWWPISDKKYSLRPVGLREYFLLVRLIRRSLRAVYWDHPMLIRSSTII